jgi:hypothetical protein
MASMKATVAGVTQCLGAVLIAAMLLSAADTAAAQTPVQKQAAKPAPKRTAPPPAKTGGSGDYWSINSDLGRYNARPTDRLPEQTSEFGRVPLQNNPGTVGFTSGSGIAATQLHDGSSVPGMERYNQTPSSGYAGLSVSVPNLNKTLPFLSPSPTPWNRNE